MKINKEEIKRFVLNVSLMGGVLYLTDLDLLKDIIVLTLMVILAITNYTRGLEDGWKIGVGRGDEV